MIYGLYLSATGVVTNSHQQDVIANNLANQETNGFRRQMSLQEARRTEVQAQQAAGTSTRREPFWDNLGGGQLLAPSYYDQTEGQPSQSSNNFDTAIRGPGFIGVEDKGEFRLTRNGSMMLDKDGFVITTAGQKVVGPDKTPLKLDMTGRKQADLQIGQDGTIHAGPDSLGKIGLFDAKDPQTIKPVGGSVFAPTKDAEIVPADARLLANMTEGSNVDPATELTRLMETQRLLEANANLIRTQDQTLGRAVNDVGKIG